MATRGFRAQGRALHLPILATLIAATAVVPAAFADVLGQPTDKALGLQPSGDEMRDTAAFFHNVILLPTIVAISLFVLALLAWIVIRYNKKANPIPAKFAHNTPLEVVWTIVPVLILTVIAAFSFPLLYKYHDIPKADLTIKATGNQWFWSYEYPDQKIAEYTSNILPEAAADKAGVPYKLATTAPIVVPVGKVTKVLVTGADVLHAFFIPAFGVQTTAIPGKVNEVWFKPRTLGTYYGECNELCGVNHAFMPIEVKVVSQADFNAWVASKAAKPSPTPVAAAPASPSATPAPAAPTQATPIPSTVAPAAAATKA
jgi:cytochrome c oxidase subunit 2